MHLLCDRYELLMIAYAASQRSATEEWLRIRLNTLAQLQRGSTQDDPSTIALPQAELADILGVSRQTLNGLLNRLAARGELEVGYRRIRLLG
jgi:CRP-like cAMP-binding protein